MLSRVAESIYWMSRYLERAENISRFMDENWLSALERFGKREQNWRTTIEAMGDTELLLKKHPNPDPQTVTEFLAFDSDYPNSILRCVEAARENARSVCEIISQDLWYRINSFYHYLLRASKNPSELHRNPHAFFDQVKHYGVTFGGIVSDTMAHGEAWHFFRMGRMLERADKTSRMLDVKYFVLLPRVEDVGSSIDVIQWAALLRSTNALDTYLRQYGTIDAAKVAEFTLFNREFPRSVRHCLEQAELSVRYVTGTLPGNYANEAEATLGRLISDISFKRIKEVMTSGLHEYVDHLQCRMNEVDLAIYHTFFSH